MRSLRYFGVLRKSMKNVIPFYLDYIMQNPDLRIYDLEYSEIIGLEFRPSMAEIQMRLRCPVMGWQWKDNITQLKNRFGLKPLVIESGNLHDVSLTFLGVSEVRETF